MPHLLSLGLLLTCAPPLPRLGESSLGLTGGYDALRVALRLLGDTADEATWLAAAGLGLAEPGSEGLADDSPLAVRNSFDPQRGLLPRIARARGFLAAVDQGPAATILPLAAGQLVAGRPVLWQSEEGEWAVVRPLPHGGHARSLASQPAWERGDLGGGTLVRLLPSPLPAQLVLLQTLRYTLAEQGQEQLLRLAEAVRDPATAELGEDLLRLLRYGRPALLGLLREADEPGLTRLTDRLKDVVSRTDTLAGEGPLALTDDWQRTRLAAALEELLPRELLALSLVRDYLTTQRAAHLALASEHLTAAEAAQVAAFYQRLGG